MPRYPAGDGTFTAHRQVSIAHGEWSAEVDERIAPLILECWRAGWPTSRSCQHHGPSRKAWIEFDHADGAGAFLSVVAADAPRSLVERMHWCFNCFSRQSGVLIGDAAGAWELHAQVLGTENATEGLGISVSVLFPRRDLSRALKHMAIFNSIELRSSSTEV